MDKKKTGILIRDARVKKGLTQSELGELLGVTNKAVSRWETGESFPDIGILEHLSELLELKIQDIVTGDASSSEGNALTELLHLAKFQQRSKQKSVLRLLAGALAALFYLLLGYIQLLHGSSPFGTASAAVSAAVLTLFLSLAVYGCLRQGGPLLPYKNKKSGWMLLLSSASFIWISAVFLIAVRTGGTENPLSAPGSFFNRQLILFFLLQLVCLIVEYVRVCTGSTALHAGFPVAVSVLHLILYYGELLHLLTDSETAAHLLLQRTLLVFGELCAALLLVLLGRRLLSSKKKAL